MKKLKDKFKEKKGRKLPKKWQDAVESVTDKNSPLYRAVSNPMRDLESTREDRAMAAFVYIALGARDHMPNTERTRKYEKELKDDA